MEEVGEERVDALARAAVGVADDLDAAVEVGGRQPVAEADQPAVGGGLGGAQRGGLGKVGVGGQEGGKAAAGLLQRVEVVDVDGVEVVERAAERGEEARARAAKAAGPAPRRPRAGGRWTRRCCGPSRGNGRRGGPSQAVRSATVCSIAPKIEWPAVSRISRRTVSPARSGTLTGGSAVGAGPTMPAASDRARAAPATKRPASARWSVRLNGPPLSSTTRRPAPSSSGVTATGEKAVASAPASGAAARRRASPAGRRRGRWPRRRRPARRRRWRRGRRRSPRRRGGSGRAGRRRRRWRRRSAAASGRRAHGSARPAGRHPRCRGR